MTTNQFKDDDLDLLVQYINPRTNAGFSQEAELDIDRVIPKFYNKDPSPTECDTLRQKLREEARSCFLQRKSTELLDNADLKKIWELLEDNHTPPSLDDEKLCNYRSFRAVGLEATPKAREFFTAATFAKFQQNDPYGRIPITSFFNYVMRKTWLRQSRIGLSLYDLTGQGFLTEKDLELYITELIPTVPHLRKIDESFQSFYVCTAVRRFLFFLDSKRLGKVRIVDILASGFLDDLLELRDDDIDSDISKIADKRDDRSKDATEKSSATDDFEVLKMSSKLDKNWFSIPNALRVYGQYLNLDSDRNGMLSKSELKQYGSGSLTDAFVQRVFEECLTYEGEMDYKAYLDFVLAMENKNDPASLQYFFRILDVRQTSYIDAFAINYFFRAIQKLLSDQDQPMVSFEDVKDEIFDMIKPGDPLKIKLRDLVDSNQGETVISILTDLNGFWTYENREYLATEQRDGEASEFL